MATAITERRYWLPIANPKERYGGTRHAFDGRRWDGDKSAISICGKKAKMRKATEIEWFSFPTCTS
ncbi:hypothetical protein A8926_7143 [Saccharopolyspora spinosa]|uniref:Uncharacterized protein n=1 Tax=Saccharopolyspora spinosa TaxID=60894 RepID=A0A2N3Y810_SACSN|nr:hypothetical protein A8926_7143 [Saccharopolyspora spinosa]